MYLWSFTFFTCTRFIPLRQILQNIKQQTHILAFIARSRSHFKHTFSFTADDAVFPIGGDLVDDWVDGVVDFDTVFPIGGNLVDDWVDGAVVDFDTVFPIGVDLVDFFFFGVDIVFFALGVDINLPADSDSGVGISCELVDS